MTHRTRGLSNMWYGWMLVFDELCSCFNVLFVSRLSAFVGIWSSTKSVYYHLCWIRNMLKDFLCRKQSSQHQRQSWVLDSRPEKVWRKTLFLEIYYSNITLRGICFFKNWTTSKSRFRFKNSMWVKSCHHFWWIESCFFALGPNIPTLHHFFLSAMDLRIVSAKQHTCSWAFVLPEILIKDLR